MLQPAPNPVVRGTQTNFDQSGETAVQPHIDYDLTISKDDKQVFQAAALAGTQINRYALVRGFSRHHIHFNNKDAYMC